MSTADGSRGPRTPFGHEEILVSRVFRIERVRFVDGAGREIVREVVRHPGAVTVVPVLDDGRLVTIRNWRIAVGGWLEEFCAGKLERGEDPAVAAARELEEETGFRASRIRPVGTFFTSPGLTDELMHVFEARGLTPVPRRLEVGEEIEVAERSVGEVEHLIRDGGIRDAKTIGAFAQWRLAGGGVA